MNYFSFFKLTQKEFKKVEDKTKTNFFQALLSFEFYNE